MLPCHGLSARPPRAVRTVPCQGALSRHNHRLRHRVLYRARVPAGVGKSTTAVNLAFTLAQMGAKVGGQLSAGCDACARLGKDCENGRECVGAPCWMGPLGAALVPPALAAAAVARSWRGLCTVPPMGLPRLLPASFCTAAPHRQPPTHPACLAATRPALPSPGRAGGHL